MSSTKRTQYYTREHTNMYGTMICVLVIAAGTKGTKYHLYKGTHLYVDSTLMVGLPGEHTYGVATISWLLKIIGLFCKRVL